MTLCNTRLYAQGTVAEKIPAAFRLTEDAHRLLSLLVEKMGIDKAIASLEQSTTRGWKGVFEPKDYKAPKKHIESAPIPTRPAVDPEGLKKIRTLVKSVTDKCGKTEA